jgi:hypothetical protein
LCKSKLLLYVNTYIHTQFCACLWFAEKIKTWKKLKHGGKKLL